MKAFVNGGKCLGQILSIPSKSYAHRIAICSYFAHKTPFGNAGDFSSQDISATENCLNDLLNGITFLDCGESGSTLRFLLPLLAVKGGNYTLTGHGKLLDRPNDELFAVLGAHGVNIQKLEDKIVVSGKLENGDFNIRGDISSQYISGLLMALPNLRGDSRIVLTTPLVSSSYVDITLEVLKEYGVKIDKTDYGFFVKGNQQFNGTVYPEGDWSNSAFFLVLGAINGDITVKGLNLDSVQGDRKIIDILKSAGACVKVANGDIKVTKSRLTAFTFDSENCPDLVPIACVLASACNGISVIKNIQRLKIKESDRITSTINMLNSFGIKAECDGVNMIVYGGKAKAGKVNSYNDHRIAMSATVLASICDGESVIDGANAINKSFPTFYKDFSSVGGQVVDKI